MAGTIKRTEFNQALKALATERGLDMDVIMDTLKAAYVAAYKRDARERGEENLEDFDYDAEIDSLSGEAKILAWDPENPDEKKDVTPPGFGRIAAQTAKQVIHQKIREAEKGALMDEYGERIGSLVSGIVLRFDGSDVRVDLGRAEGLMPSSERVPNERLSPGQRLSFLLKDIEETPRGKQIILSRADKRFVEKIFAREVPEISSGSVEIKKIVREPGVRTKIAVYSDQSGVDPVGSCVGQKGVRVQSVTNELGGERIDIIPWTEDERELIKAALSPVEVLSMKEGKNEEGEPQIVVTVPEDQLSLAIGKEGQNVRLTSKLTGWKLEIKGVEAKGSKGTEKTEKLDGAEEITQESEPEPEEEQE